MAVCKFFLQGNCRFGDHCKNEHPRDKPPGFTKPTNPFEVLNRDSPGHGRGYNQYDNSPGPRKFGEEIPANRYKLDPEAIKKDLTTDLPVYIFSCYAPSRDVPVNLFGGQPREQSFEEWRLNYYQLDAQGKALEARNQEDTLRVAAEQQIQAALNDVQGAVRYVREAENKHPNRIDVVEGRATNEDQAGFGGDSARQSGPFGRLDVTPNAGNPFASRQPGPSTPFGGPQQQAPSNPFGGPQQAGSANPFGQPQQPKFGTTSFGTAPPQPGFGQPAQTDRPVGPFEPGAPPNSFNRMAGGASNPATDSSFNPTPGNPFAGGGQTMFGPAKTYEPSTAAKNAFGATQFAQATQAIPQAQANPFVAAGGASKPNPFGSPGGFAPNGSNNAGPQNPFPPAGPNQPAQQGFGNNPNAMQNNSAGQQNSGPQFSIFDNQIENNSAPREYGPPLQIDEQPFRREGDYFVQNIPGEGRRELRNVPAKVLTSFRGQKVHLHCEITSQNVVGTKKMDYTYWPYFYDQRRRKVRIWQEEPKDWKGRPADDPPEDAYTIEVRDALGSILRNMAFKDNVMPEFPLPRADTNFDV